MQQHLYQPNFTTTLHVPHGWWPRYPSLWASHPCFNGSTPIPVNPFVSNAFHSNIAAQTSPQVSKANALNSAQTQDVAPAASLLNSKVVSTSSLDLEKQFQSELADMYLDAGSRPSSRLSKAEASIAQALRAIFGPNVHFEKARLPWLTNPRTKRKLELDIWCESLSCGFERQGLQHYVWPNGLHASRAQFEALQERDKLKMELCKQHGVTLIHVPFTVSAKDMEAFLRDELRRFSIPVPDQASHSVAGQAQNLKGLTCN